MFHFKKFSIDDTGSAMKTGTDAVLLGAWAPTGEQSRILDIGTGSGILALMMAQRTTDSLIDAVEIHKDAFELAMKNVEISPWKSRIRIHHVSFQDFSNSASHLYEFIISNPPFFSNALKNPDPARSLARHDDSLQPHELFYGIDKLLTKEGQAALIFPFDVLKDRIFVARLFSLFPLMITSIRSSPQHKPHRAMVLFGKTQNQTIIEDELVIYSLKSVYSEAYKELTRDFYLKF